MVATYLAVAEQNMDAGVHWRLEAAPMRVLGKV